MAVWNAKKRDIRYIQKSFHIQANNETVNYNVLQFTGTIQIVNQWAEVTEVIAATNMENVYGDIWDGTNSKLITANTADFSGLVANAFFSKILDTTEEMILHNPTENRLTDVTIEDIGQPFIITAKNGVNNYIRFNFTTNTILDITLNIIFGYRVINGGTLAFV